ncbi:mechanosensitive ion channel family protein [Nocardioides perillae]|uniref:Small-conductance mechanosensitive channel n=1 Tax=Nocardioides perillae TaxID=1119534 RepID=A0A7Y9RQD8_9ACTN|nr:mechanosensitive ion channel domain-containing protein [Nocardioides perillae]NYG54607.1 small-conductance mechanosensitive channel [Nocardioides perillae]
MAPTLLPHLPSYAVPAGPAPLPLVVDDAADVVPALAPAVLGALAVVVGVHLLVRVASRRWPPLRDLARAARIPFRVLVVLVALNPAVAALRPRADEAAWWGWAALAAQVLAIVATGWFVTSVALFVADQGLRRYRTDVADNRLARQRRTQTMVIRRLTVAAGVVVTAGAVLLSFPGVRVVGASVLASAGLISVVAGLAAQSVLSNVFAGVQLAFNDAIRLDDAVIVEGEWGWIEEITLTYVVVRIWDDRRLVLPSTWFTTTPFQNWTREHSELLGSVELDLDWRVDTDAMRRELDRALETTDLWDGRAKVLQVTDAVGGWVRVRVLVTAQDAPSLFDLRCHVREHLVGWVRDHADAGLPRQRVELVGEPPARPQRGPAGDQAGLFHGDAAAEARAQRMGTGSVPVVRQDDPRR